MVGMQPRVRHELGDLSTDLDPNPTTFSSKLLVYFYPVYPLVRIGLLELPVG